MNHEGLLTEGRMMRAVSLGLIGLLGVGLTGCRTMDEHRTVTGAVAGTVVGAAAGALIAEDSAKGALIGAAAGAAIGGGVGYLLQRQKDKFDKIEGVEATEQTVLVPQQQTGAEAGGAEAWEDGAEVQPVEYVETQGLTLNLQEQVLFAVNSSALTSAGTTKVAEIAAVLREFPDSDVFILGYTSSDGGDAYNVELSQRRADAVRNTLIANQVAANRLTALGMGASNPIASNDTAEGRSANRRVEIIVVPREEAAA
jgi:outer membrane protein OmpA-like peptidoglycan-associated protein